MSKLPGRIPAHMAAEATRWELPEINPEATNKVFKMQSPSRRRTKAIPVVDEPVAGPDEDAAVEISQDENVPEKAGSGEIPCEEEALDEIASPQVPDSAASRDDAYEVKLKEAQTQGFAEGEARGFLEGEVKGFEKGEIAGREQGRREAESAFAEDVDSRKKLLEELFSELRAPVDDVQVLKDSLLQLVTNLAEVVILSELQSNPEHIRKLVDSALEAVPHGQNNIKVNVNPMELEWLKEVGSNLAADVEFVADPDLSIGSCKVLSAGSSIDGTLSKRIHDCLIKVFADERIQNLTEADLLQTASEMSDD